MDPKTTAALALAEAVHEHALADAAYVDDCPEGTEEERLAALRKAHIVLVGKLKEYRGVRDAPQGSWAVLCEATVDKCIAVVSARKAHAEHTRLHSNICPECTRLGVAVSVTIGERDVVVNGLAAYRVSRQEG